MHAKVAQIFTSESETFSQANCANVKHCKQIPMGKYFRIKVDWNCCPTDLVHLNIQYCFQQSADTIQNTAWIVCTWSWLIISPAQLIFRWRNTIVKQISIIWLNISFDSMFGSVKCFSRKYCWVYEPQNTVNILAFSKHCPQTHSQSKSCFPIDLLECISFS